ncbi:MAG: hypothetical protein ACM3PY_16850 [Omnitrophica WOR_2 bacterium]
MLKMTSYDLLCNTGRALIKGQVYSDDKKQEIVKTLLSGMDTPETVDRFLGRVKAQVDGRMMYPLFYTPPYNGGKKYRLITGQMPKTHLLSANHYELEILRLLTLWGSDQDQVAQMIDQSLKRLDATCFGHFCSEGECIGAGVSTLRLLSALRPVNNVWIEEILKPLGDIFSGIKGQAATNHNLPVFYFCLALSGIKSDMAAQIIRDRKDFLLTLLKRGWLTGPAENDKYTPLTKYVIRNTLACLPECEYLQNAEIYISDKDGRVYCDDLSAALLESDRLHPHVFLPDQE